MDKNPRLMDLSLGSRFEWKSEAYVLIAFHSQTKHPQGTAKCVRKLEYLAYQNIAKESRKNNSDLYVYVPLTDYVKHIPHE